MGGIYEVAVEIASGGMASLPSFMRTGAGVQEILSFFCSNFGGCNVIIIYWRYL
jgi:hypothetical protein